MSATVGLFGLGLVGAALTARLISGGHRVIGHDPAADRMDALADAGGTATEPENVWTADTVLAAVFDTDQLAGLIAAAPGGLTTTLVATSTCDPDRMADVGRAAAAKGITLIEAPLSGTSRDLALGNAIFLLGGAAGRIAALDWLWPVLGRASYHVGELGNGNRAKLAINLVLGLNRAALAEGLVFAEAIGLDPAELLPLLRDSAAASSVMGSKGPKMVARDFAPLGRIAQSAKDFALIRDIANKAGQALPFAGVYAAMMAQCMDNGQGDLDNAAILLAIKAAAADG